MSSRRVAFAAVALVASAASPLAARAQSAPAQAQLDAITARGRALAGYQRAAWNATVQLMATNPDPGQVQRYVAYHADSGWVVAFGHLDSQRDTFYVSNIAVPALVNGQRVDSLFEFHKFEAAPDIDFLVRATRAMDTAVAAMGPKTRPYRAAAIPAENGDWWVYLTPASDFTSAFPLGDDVRFRISADADRILETRRMHKGIVEYNRGDRPGAAKLVASSHKTSLRDEPEDSDIYYVLSRRPQVPEIVETKHFRYLVDLDGSIKLLQGHETVVGVR
jgi:hypothetical protein